MHRLAIIFILTSIASMAYFFTHQNDIWIFAIVLPVELIGLGLYELGKYRKYQRQRMQRSRYTLLEILIVVALVFILAGMVLAIMGPVKRHMRDTKSKAQIKQFQLMLESYYQDWGYYPQQATAGIITAEMLSSFRSSDQGAPLFRAEDFDYDNQAPSYDYIDPNPAPGIDPLTVHYQPVNGHSQPFYYQSPGSVHPESYDIWCAGYDGLFGGNAVLSAAGTSTPADAQAIDARPEDANDDIANWKRLH
jgi:type II secretory pathway pseudopilin PulG